MTPEQVTQAKNLLDELDRKKRTLSIFENADQIKGLHNVSIYFLAGEIDAATGEERPSIESLSLLLNGLGITPDEQFEAILSALKEVAKAKVFAALDKLKCLGVEVE